MNNFPDSLFLECEIDAAETALRYGVMPYTDAVVEAKLIEQHREQERIRIAEYRLEQRIRRKHTEERECPVCHVRFVVVVHAESGGRPRIYDRPACRVRACRKRNETA